MKFVVSLVITPFLTSAGLDCTFARAHRRRADEGWVVVCLLPGCCTAPSSSLVVRGGPAPPGSQLWEMPVSFRVGAAHHPPPPRQQALAGSPLTQHSYTQDCGDSTGRGALSSSHPSPASCLLPRQAQMRPVPGRGSVYSAHV